MSPWQPMEDASNEGAMEAPERDAAPMERQGRCVPHSYQWVNFRCHYLWMLAPHHYLSFAFHYLWWQCQLCASMNGFSFACLNTRSFSACSGGEDDAREVFLLPCSCLLLRYASQNSLDESSQKHVPRQGTKEKPPYHNHHHTHKAFDVMNEMRKWVCFAVAGGFGFCLFLFLSEARMKVDLDLWVSQKHADE